MCSDGGGVCDVHTVVVHVMRIVCIHLLLNTRAQFLSSSIVRYAGVKSMFPHHLNTTCGF